MPPNPVTIWRKNPITGLYEESTDANPSSMQVLGHTDRLTQVFRSATVAAGAGEIALPASPPTYDAGDVIGGEFSFQMGRSGGPGTGFMYSFAVLELLESGAYINQAVTADATANTIGLVGHTLLNGNRVKFGGTAVPGALTAGVSYWVVNKATDSFQVSTTPGGSAVDLTSAGTSPTLTEVPLMQSLILWPFESAPPDVADNDPFNPSVAVFTNAKAAVSLSYYRALGQGLHAAGRDDGDRRAFKSSDGSIGFVPVYDGFPNAVYSKYATLIIRAYPVQD